MNKQNKIIYIIKLINSPDTERNPIILYLDLDENKDICLYNYDSTSLSVDLSENLRLYNIFFNYGKKYNNLNFKFKIFDYKKEFNSLDFVDTIQKIIKILKYDRINNTNAKE